MYSGIKHVLLKQNIFKYSPSTKKLLQKSSIPTINNFSYDKYYSDAISYKINTPYALYKLDQGPSLETNITKAEALKYYRQMAMIRRFETASTYLYQQKQARGFLHLYNGEEAIAVGICASMRPQDVTIGSYRCHGYAYLCGISIEGILAEICGRVDGCQRGKGGSMHMYNEKMYGGNGIVGDHVPIGTGIALAFKYSGKDKLCIVSYGDGAANSGQISEVFNIAKLWKIPIIYLCENNLYGYSTSISRAAANTQFYTRGDLIPGIKCDGMDVIAIRDACKFAINFVLKNSTPIILEAVTYRYFGHSMSDPGTSYRTKEEIDDVKNSKDCINLFKNKIIKLNLTTDTELKNIDSEIKKEVDKCAEIAKKSKFIDVEEIGYDVYSNDLVGTTRNNLYWEPIHHKNLNLSRAFNIK